MLMPPRRLFPLLIAATLVSLPAAVPAAGGTRPASPLGHPDSRRSSPTAAIPSSIEACISIFEGTLDTTGMQPKDFAMISRDGVWHLFYTRQHMTPNYTDATNTRSLGHAISTDAHLSAWTVVDRAAIQVRDGRAFDNLHVWAPSIVADADTFYMFYTGVQLDTVATVPSLVTTQIQRIGLATSTDLDTWTQEPEPLLSAKQLPWTYQDSTALGNGGVGWQLRDPFVMRDPAHAGEWLMYYVAIDSTLGKFVVGEATTAGGNLRAWKDVQPLRRTSAAFFGADRVESPFVFERNGVWWMLWMANHDAGQDQIAYALSASGPSDSAGWSPPDSLKRITCGQHDYPSALNTFYALEHFTAGRNEMIGGYSRTLAGEGTIQFTRIVPPGPGCPTDSLDLTCPEAYVGVGPRSAAPPSLGLSLAGPSPARSSVELSLTLARRGRVVVSVFDSAGRRIATLADTTLDAGAHRLRWNGRGATGERAGSGVYFVRARTADGERSVRVVLAR